MLNNVIIEVQVSQGEVGRLIQLIDNEVCVPCKVWLRAEEGRVALIRSKDKLAADLKVSEPIAQLLQVALKNRIGIVEVNINVEDKILAISMLQDTVVGQHMSNPTDALVVTHDLSIEGMLHRSEEIIDTRCDADDEDVDGGWDFEVRLS